jgi:hypothetical protein
VGNGGEATKAFVEAVQSGDVEAIRATMAESVELRSPYTDDVYSGPERVGGMIADFRGSIDGFEYFSQTEGDGLHVLLFRGTVEGSDVRVEGIDVVRADNGRIHSVTALLRPALAMMELGRIVGPKHGLGPPPGG